MLNEEEKMKAKLEFTEIVEDAIKENGWERLTSKDFGEYYTPTDIGKEIIVSGKNLSGQKVNKILEEMDYIKRDGERIILTEKGKKVGRYVICIKINSSKSIINNIAYAKYRKSIIQDIQNYLDLKQKEENKNGK